MKTNKIKANLVNMPLIGCPGAEGASWALPADDASYERMVEQMDSAITCAINKWLAGGGPKACQDAPRAALRAIGITPPARQARKGLQKGTP